MSDPQIITVPGAVDLHVHLREPSTNKAETISSGTKAALLGGFVAICDMPNNPGSPTWTLDRLQAKQKIIEEKAYIPVATYAGSQPESDNIDELEKMAVSAIGLKLYGGTTTGNDKDYSPADFLTILKKWKQVAPNKPIMLHSGKDNLEEFIKLIVANSGQRLHVCHVNSPDDVHIISKYKKHSLPITCGVCPHHLFMASHDVKSRGWFARMKPPLISQDKAEELLEMLASGQIDIVETDHAPHSIESKMATGEENPEGIDNPSHKTCYGVPGLEFALPLLFYQMRQGRLTLERIIDATSTKPAKIIGLKISGRTKVTWQLKDYRINNEKTQTLSGSGWTPYLGMLASGKVKEVTIGGKTLVRGGKITSKYPKVINAGDEI
ncbi:dihydroorotase family protein [Candidatus Saccharibacteria bacterium]|nr:dihydroorotase family protein [Candidatus Saccharibacteria bacterium]